MEHIYHTDVANLVNPYVPHYPTIPFIPIMKLTWLSIGLLTVAGTAAKEDCVVGCLYCAPSLLKLGVLRPDRAVSIKLIAVTLSCHAS